MQGKLYEYCPKCKKAVTVIKNGNRKNKKQCYLCKCGRQFTDRNYQIELRCVSSKIGQLKNYSFRAVAKMFKISPNTVRNWGKIEYNCQISYNELLEILKKYKELCESINILIERISELNNLEQTAIKYQELKEKEDNTKNVFEQEHIHKQILVLLEPLRKKYTNFAKNFNDYRNPELWRNKLLTAKKELNTQKQIKSDLEKQTPIAREKYDIAEIIKALEILQNQK